MCELSFANGLLGVVKDGGRIRSCHADPIDSRVVYAPAVGKSLVFSRGEPLIKFLSMLAPLEAFFSCKRATVRVDSREPRNSKTSDRALAD